MRFRCSNGSPPGIQTTRRSSCGSASGSSRPRRRSRIRRRARRRATAATSCSNARKSRQHESAHRVGLDPNTIENSDHTFSKNAEVDAAIKAGETAFTSGRLDDALAAYERAYRLDPKSYEAALYAGDVAYQKQAWEQAATWFSRAIAIDPDRETAYRYWGDALFVEGRVAEARDRYVDAIVAEPYAKQSYAGLLRWAQRADVELVHPHIEIPTDLSDVQGNKMTITVDPKLLDGKEKQDGSDVWLLYGIARAAWPTLKFKATYPNENEYRHSLAEEVDALGMVVEEVRQRVRDHKIKALDPSLAALVRLADAGLLEAYVLFARADEGLAQDYDTYRKAHRDALRRYWIDVVVAEGIKKASA